MKNFNKDALLTADIRTHELYFKIANMKPTEDIDTDDINALLFYLSDYRAELKREHRERDFPGRGNA